MILEQIYLYVMNCRGINTIKLRQQLPPTVEGIERGNLDSL